MEIYHQTFTSTFFPGGSDTVPVLTVMPEDTISIEAPSSTVPSMNTASASLDTSPLSDVDTLAFIKHNYILIRAQNQLLFSFIIRLRAASLCSSDNLLGLR